MAQGMVKSFFSLPLPNFSLNLIASLQLQHLLHTGIDGSGCPRLCLPVFGVCLERGLLEAERKTEEREERGERRERTGRRGGERIKRRGGETERERQREKDVPAGTHHVIS